MLLPLAVAVGSVALGAALALSGRAAGPTLASIRTLALVAATVVVLAQLLPDALAAIGPWALVVFLLAGGLPVLGERVWMALAERHGHASTAAEAVGLELGYIGLLVHKLGDGLGLGAFGGSAGPELQPDVLVAIAIHTVPVVAILVLGFRQRSGLLASVVRAAGLALAAAAGVLLTELVPRALVHQAEPWITAIVGGLLLHVVAHDWQSEGTPTKFGRASDLAAIVLGIGLVWLAGDHGHGSHGAGLEIREELGRALLRLILLTSPALLLGLLGAALILWLGRGRVRAPGSGSPLSQALGGSVFGAAVPVRAFGLLPWAAALHRQPAPAAFVISFLVATPELGLETLALGVRFFGWPFALSRGVVAVAAALAAGILAAIVRRRHGGALFRSEEHGHEDAHGLGSHLLGHVERLLHHVGPWMLVGLVTAAYLQAALPGDALADWNGGLAAVAALTAIALPGYVSPMGATPVAAVLASKGLSPGVVLAALVIGSVLHFRVMRFWAVAYGGRSTLVATLAVIAVAWAGALSFDAMPVTVKTDGVEALPLGWGSYLGTALLGVLVLRAVWREGLGRWLGSLGGAVHTHAHTHRHGG